jgi:subtilisin family serine protease
MKLKFVGLVMSLIGASAFAESVPNRLLVKYAPNRGALSMMTRSPAELGALSMNLKVASNIVSLRFASGLSTAEAAKILRLSPGVLWAQPDYILRTLPIAQTGNDLSDDSPFSSLEIFSSPVVSNPNPNPNEPGDLPNPGISDPRATEAWGLTKIQADKAWNETQGSASVVVADIDTGIDYNHEDLVNNLWRAADGQSPGYDFVNNDALPYDDQSHGTHTAGTIGATGFNGLGIVGVSPKVSIMALKFLSAQGSGTTSDAIRAIDFAIEHKVRVMSNSWGGSPGEGDDGSEDKALREAVARANHADILFVAAAGNDGQNIDVSPVYPGGIDLPNVLTVASTTERDTRSFFSNYGPTKVHVAAPGSNILSTVPSNGYKLYSGTSMACPHVAGLAALILSVRPELTAVQVKEMIMQTVDPIPSLRGKIVTGGRVNAQAALKGALSFGL